MSIANLSQIVANVDAFESISVEMDSKDKSPIPQPVLIVGQEGTGKTTLLSRLIRTREKDKCLWIDGRTVFSSDYIIGLCMRENASFVFIDDIDYYFSRCGFDEQYRLRRFLNEEGAPMLLATISRVMPALAEYGAPFFEGVKSVYLKPVSIEVLESVFNKSQIGRATAMFHLLPPTIESVLQISYAIKLSNAQSKDTAVLLRFYSGKYKHIYDGLPAHSQHILNALAEEGDSMAIPELRERSGLPTNILTAYLKSLRDNGIVSVDKSGKRHSRYAIKSALFRLWLRQSNQPLDRR